MTLNSKKNYKNPNRRPMSVADMSFPVSNDNQKVLTILDEMDSNKSKKEQNKV